MLRRRFMLTAVPISAISVSATTLYAWPGKDQSVNSLRLLRNISDQLVTIVDKQCSPYTTTIQSQQAWIPLPINLYYCTLVLFEGVCNHSIYLQRTATFKQQNQNDHFTTQWPFHMLHMYDVTCPCASSTLNTNWSICTLRPGFIWTHLI